MKKLNNKGFAVSTLIYGLSIMGIMIVAILMATMAQTRTNNTNLAKAIEEDLNRFSKTETSFKPVNNSAPSSQEYIVPSSGWYKIELWGARGGANGGKGAYTGGVIELTEGDVLFFYVGAHRNSSGGGYSSSVRIVDGTYNDPLSYESSIMVAAGGGTSETASGGTLRGYGDKMVSYGGFINSSSASKDFSLLAANATDNNTNGTLVGFIKNYEVSGSTNPSVNANAPSPVSTNGGGDGYFASTSATTGGSSFIAGYAGAYGLSKGKTTLNSRVEYHAHKYTESDGSGQDTYETSAVNYYFVDGLMYPGVNTGDGYARIERVRTKSASDTILIRKNTKLNNIKCIRDCTNTSGATWTKIVATVKGVTYQPALTTSGTTCRIANLGSNLNVDEIAVFHGKSGVDYTNNKISVSTNCSNWVDVKTSTGISETETVTGYRISAYQYDNTTTLPTRGNYIIQPVLSENKVLTAAASAETNANPISIEYYTGEKRQKWSIELITDTNISPGYRPGVASTYEYKIVELARYKALAITQDENVIYNTVSAIDKFNEYARNEPQIWKITPRGDGTYKITSVVASQGNVSGDLIAQTNSTVSDALNQIIIGRNNNGTARFRLIQVDYSSN